MPKTFRIFILAYWLFFIGFTTLVPTVPYNGEMVSFYDKIFHVILFGVMAYLVVFALRPGNNKKLFKALAIAFVCALAYSLLVELLQEYVPGRAVSVYDLYAGLTGIVLALFYAYAKHRR